MTAPLPLIPVQAAVVGEWWPLVVARVAAVAQSEDWSAADVLRLLARGDAELWATPGAEGFIIACVNITPWGRTLFVWIGCNEDSGASAFEYVPQVRAIARCRGCDRFEWESDRKGYQRAFPGVRARFLYSMEA